MKFKDKIHIFNKKSKLRKELDLLISNLPNSNIIAKDLLEELGNKKTKYIFDKDIKGSYYVYLNDTIYLCDKQKEKNNYERLCVIAHESIHSIQPKFLQNLNFILSNLELVCFVVFLILYFLKLNRLYIYLGYITFAVLSMIPRLILELWALTKAPKLSKKYLEKNSIDKNDVDKVYNLYTFSTKLLMPVAIIGFFTYKLVRMFIATILLLINK